MLVLPLYRLAVPNWPGEIVEHLLPDGRVLLRERSRVFRGGGVARSRPANAARIEFVDGRVELAYVVAMRLADEPATPPPDGMAWTPPRGPAACELAIRSANDGTRWEPCGAIAEVSKPNRMAPAAQLRMALQQVLPDWRIQP